MVSDLVCDEVAVGFNIVLDGDVVVAATTDVIAGSAMQQSYNQIFPAPLTGSLY